jgi:hypothetical protein
MAGLLILVCVAVHAQDSQTPRREFDDIARRLMRENTYFNGVWRSQQIRARRDASRDTTQRLTLTYDLVHVLLKTGDTAEAMREVESLFDQLQQFPGLEAREPQFQRLRALTYLRQAEIENCVRRHNAECCLFPLKNEGRHKDKAPAREAQRSYNRLLQGNPADLTALWFLNLTAMALGEFPDGVPESRRIQPAALRSEFDIGLFPDIAAPLGLDTLDHAGGCVVDDLDGDGLFDVVTSSSWPTEAMTYLRNTGSGRFEDRSQPSQIDDQRGGLNLVAGDYNNDGHLDIVVLRGAWLYDQGRIRNSLIRNNGDGTFTDVTHKAGLASPAYPSQTATWLDYDNDGLLDLYVGNESRADRTQFPKPRGSSGDFPAQLFRNMGDGTFRDVARAAGVTNDRYCKGLATGDFDNDGDADLYVSNFGANRLYRNNADGTFTDIAPALGVTAPQGRSFATWFFDYNNDGWLDLFVAAYEGTLDGVAASYLGRQHRYEPPRLYRNDAGVGFSDVTRQCGLDRPFLPMGASFGDLDNDGFLDIYLATGAPHYEVVIPNIMLRNDQGRRFQDVTFAGGFGHLQKGHAVSFADVDNDGDQDVFTQMGGFFRGDAFHNALFHNRGHGHRWLAIDLHGTTTNRSGHGVRIMVEVQDGDHRRRVHRAAGSVSSFGSTPRRVEIGLGNAASITRLELFWPTSATTQSLDSVPLDSHIRVTEKQSTFERLDRPALPLSGVAN